MTVVQIEGAVEMYDEERLVSREDRARPVEGLDVESAGLCAGRKGSNLKWVSVKKDGIGGAKRMRKEETSCMKNAMLCSRKTL